MAVRLRTREVPPPLPLLSRKEEDEFDNTPKPPKTSGIRIIWPGPRHIHYVPPFHEPSAEKNPAILERLLLDDARRRAEPERVINRKVPACPRLSPPSTSSVLGPTFPARYTSRRVVAALGVIAQDHIAVQDNLT